MKRAALIVVLLAVIGYIALCAALFVFERALLYFPQPRAVADPASTMRLSVDGAELVVSIRPHAGSKAIIYFGGNAEDVSLSLATFGAWFPDHALYLLHYRGYGGSTGAPTEQAMRADAAALLATVQAAHPDVVVIGRSLGSGVAARLASEHRVARLVLVTPFDNIADIGAAAYPYVPVRWLLRDRYDSGAAAARIRCPTTLVVAENDTLIPRASSARLLASFAPGVATMTIIPDAGHNTIGMSDAYRLALLGAL
jgi:pimeloyl-ACP methyl ester carboxylesterase